MDLAKGERAIIHLATMDLRCSDLVVWNISDTRVETALHAVTPIDRAKNALIHYWQLRAGEVPLTTGPALVMKGDIALSQDKIHYTPRRTTGRFRAGTAVSVAGSASETVLSRKPGSKEVKDRQSHHGTTTFWLMREVRWTDELRELTMQVKNGQKIETEVHVTREFRGRPEKTNQVTFRTVGGMTDSQDQVNRLTWEISLKPGETKEVRVVYTARVFTQK